MWQVCFSAEVKMCLKRWRAERDAIAARVENLTAEPKRENDGEGGSATRCAQVLSTAVLRPGRAPLTRLSRDTRRGGPKGAAASSTGYTTPGSPSSG